MGIRTAASILVVGLVLPYVVEGIYLKTSFDACCGRIAEPLFAFKNIGCNANSKYNPEQLVYATYAKREQNPKFVLLDIPDYMNRRKMLLKKLRAKDNEKHGYLNHLID